MSHSDAAGMGMHSTESSNIHLTYEKEPNRTKKEAASHAAF